MKIATLRLAVSPKRRTLFNVVGPGVTKSYIGPTMAEIERLRAGLAELDYSADAAQRARVLRKYAHVIGPPGFAAWFRQWTGDPHDDSVLCVHAEDARLSSLPWGEILIPTGVSSGRGWVVRVCNPKGPPPPSPLDSVRMVLAAWASLTGFTLSGVVRELQEFPSKIDKSRVTLEVLAEPTRRALLAACGKGGATWVHLSPPAVIRKGSNLALPVTAEDERGSSSRRSQSSAAGAPFDSLPLAELCKVLHSNKDLRMVLLNACHAGIDGCGQIARALKAVAIGWPALVTDDIAADFTFYFYQRLIEGSSPLLAVRSFARAIGTSPMPVDVPVVWLPSPEWVQWHPLRAPETEIVPTATVTPPAGPRGGAAEGDKRRKIKPGRPTKVRNPDYAPGRKGAKKLAEVEPVGAPPPPTVAPAAAPNVPISITLSTPPPTPPIPGLRLEFRPRSAINPALLVNGLHPIEHINIDSPVEQEVHLCIVCDTGADTSTYRQTVTLRKGVVPVTTSEIHFPALHELIERHSHRRRISFTATLTDPRGQEITGQTRTSLWMGAKEWLDREDTWAFIPAFVNPFDDGVLKVFELAKKVLRTLGNPADTFTGYRQHSPSPEYVSTQMKAIFQTLRDDTIGLTYISPPGSPVFDSSSQSAIGQVVRTHGEVIDRRLGTCHDLALLLAACAEYVGIRPLIGLLPGHTFVGYWTGVVAQEKYWKNREKRLRTGKFGEGWTITDGEELFRLVNKREVALVEATFVCQREKTFDEACKFRAEALKKSDRELLDVVIDIYAARREVQPV